MAVPPLVHWIGEILPAIPFVEIEVVPQRIVATCFDTTDLRLTRAGLSVRRGTSGDGSGWQVEIPGTDALLLVELPAGRAAVSAPAAIRGLVWASTRGDALRPVARIVKDRTIHRLMDASGEVVVELADDMARGERLDDAAAADSSIPERRVIWVTTAVPEWMDAVAAALRQIGAREVDARPDLAPLRNQQDDLPGMTDVVQLTDRPSPESPAGEVVLRYVHEQCEQIIHSDPLVRIDIPGSVHRMRVATRRLRSALQTFGPVLRSEAVAPLRSELRWLASELGAARDAEVMRERMVIAVREEDDRVHLGPLGDAVDTTLSDAYRTAHDGLLRALDSERYHRIVIALHELVNDPPLSAKALRPANRILPRRAARAYARLKALVTAAHDASSPSDRETQFHEARKAAKKARYTGESMAEFFGKPATRFATAMEKLQEELGEHQDSVVMRTRLEELALHETSPTAAFAYGRLHAQEEQRGELALQRFETAWQKSKKKKKLSVWFG